MAPKPVPPHDFADILVLPHFDAHVVRNATPPLQLKLDVMFRFRRNEFQQRYDVPTVVGNEDFAWTIQFFAPHNEPPKPAQGGQPAQPGRRFDNLPTVDPLTGVVTATTLGVYLYQIELKAANGDRLGSAVGRLQVHDRIVDWWFGNDSLTTALSPGLAHSQVSMYARFSDDNSGADLVGDITGHDYFPLTSGDPAKVAVDPRGRVRGLAVTTAPVTVSGQAPGKVNTLPVRVVDYAKARQDLRPLHIRDLAQAQQLCNLAFVAEGFTDTAVDKELFDSLATQTSVALFTDKPRQEPYAELGNSFNAFKVFAPSQQQTITCGFQVTDNNAVLGNNGNPIPFPGRVPGGVAGDFNLEQLVQIVGLPKQGETRTPQQLRDLWARQGLRGYSPNNVRGDALVNAWRNHVSDGFLQASDTLFGLYLGSRWADGSSVPTSGEPAAPVPSPLVDEPGQVLSQFIARLYDFYKQRPQREMTLDPRRHPPELYATKDLTNPGNSVIAYLAGLQYVHPPNHPIGQNWVPHDGELRRSRGLVAIVAYDEFLGGTCFNNGTLTGETVSSAQAIRFTNPDPSRPELMRRVPPAPPTPDRPLGIVNADHFINKVAHELGHSFNLGDEYEDFGSTADPGVALDRRDPEADNLSRIGFLQVPGPQRLINPDLVKWLALPRMRMSSRLLTIALQDDAPPHNITVTVPKGEMPQWVRAWNEKIPVSLLGFVVTPTRRQLPLRLAAADLRFLPNTTIVAPPDENAGTFVLANPTGALYPFFEAGSVVYVPVADANGQPVTVTDPRVAAFLRQTRTPLNSTRDLTRPDQGVQTPVPVPQFAPPLDAYRVVGIYEGGNGWSRGFYRPAGACKMRNQEDADDKRGSFCFVCKWLIVNHVDPSRHAAVDKKYYPR
ncbi:hypothetical protein [Nonomuraea zeae]|uniref:Uncharacterized protein n=1 Tax=Nonomuraea zeae TaxID=1642303 RepID=A0A5S4FYJ3_9ACTN|nr:hypothetical protein [Nonomuraea zeae]TMR25877.1 hypothetical protein ETD85_44460 [Nonomuraea zeae]